jgi:iron complex transport system ATP-binding protein
VTDAAGAAVDLRDISVVFDGKLALDRLAWRVDPGERWVVLGPNGSGKTTLVRIVSLYLHPSRGEVCVLGAVLGRVDIRKVRPRIGIASASMAAMLRRELEVIDVVMTARNAALEPWWHTYTDDDRARALSMLDRFGMREFAGRMFGTLSSGEQQKVQLARTLMADPELLILDEPAAGLDLGAREDLVARLGDLAEHEASPPIVLVTHHVDEIPRGFTHALLLRRGRAVASGPIDEALTASTLSECFAMSLSLERRDDRWSARALPG